MANSINFIDGVLFGPDGLPRLQSVPIQGFAMGRGVEVPHLTSVFRTPAPTDYLVVKMQRSDTTFVVHFPIQPRPSRHVRRANVLVCRAVGAFERYANCAQTDFALAAIAAGFALAYCRDHTPDERQSEEVVIREAA
ncbi:hypothetical protein C8T65DRAFT_743349 [Cerioporus squamosus]|nr:hypothetical protein C8T65DRAFT_702134 [Cerioporus squamosus]KAI0697111.1 hypothetical protein C8T65DRAFT_743349 [Cerioporus squamosus]